MRNQKFKGMCIIMCKTPFLWKNGGYTHIIYKKMWLMWIVNGAVHIIHMRKYKAFRGQDLFIHTLSPSYSQVIPTMWITLWGIFTRST